MVAQSEAKACEVRAARLRQAEAQVAQKQPVLHLCQRGQPVYDFLRMGAAKRLHLEQLPGDAPELNPDEGIGNYVRVQKQIDVHACTPALKIALNITFECRSLRWRFGIRTRWPIVRWKLRHLNTPP
jgi:hypothetical protein